MESECFQAYKSLVSEITEGMEQVKQLRASFPNNQDTFLDRMVSSYEEALLILNGSAPEEQCQSVVSSALGPPDFSASVCKVTQSDVTQNQRKKRKAVPRWTEKIKVHTETVSGEITDDGDSWRKYGQKAILGKKYPRCYYRCAYKFSQGCPATKQVERAADDPSVREVTYYGKHTCTQVSHQEASMRNEPPNN